MVSFVKLRCEEGGRFGLVEPVWSKRAFSGWVQQKQNKAKPFLIVGSAFMVTVRIWVI